MALYEEGEVEYSASLAGTFTVSSFNWRGFVGDEITRRASLLFTCRVRDSNSGYLLYRALIKRLCEYQRFRKTCEERAAHGFLSLVQRGDLEGHQSFFLAKRLSKG